MTDFPITVLENHHDHTVRLNQDFRFEVEGPYFTTSVRDRLFDALADAKAEIFRRHQDKIKEEALKVKLDLRVMLPDGEVVTVTRINRTTGDIQGAKNYKHVYPYDPNIRARVLHRVDLAKELEALDEKLKKTQIRVSRDYGKIDLDDLPLKIKALQVEYDQALAEAKAQAKAEREAAETTNTPNLKLV